MPQTNWIIWSNEHKSWWRGNSNGYSIHFSEAGRYTFDEATEICTQANAYCGENYEPYEIMLPESCFGSRNLSTVRDKFTVTNPGGVLAVDGEVVGIGGTYKYGKDRE